MSTDNIPTFESFRAWLIVELSQLKGAPPAKNFNDVTLLPPNAIEIASAKTTGKYHVSTKLHDGMKFREVVETLYWQVSVGLNK